MDLGIDMGSVNEVLLPDGQWHRVENDSFEVGAYEYFRATEVRQGGGDAGVRGGVGEEEVPPARGARWTETSPNGKKRRVFCPITAIQALSYSV